MTDDSLNWQNDVKKGDSLDVRVIPKSFSNRISAEILEDGSKRIRVYVTTVAEGGKANAAVLKLLAKALGLPKSALSITRGELSRDKIIKIKT